ncbi:MAG: translational GTPase TypA [Verrucomicrobia bacterium]|nr:translational GTPase TypA [Verrucomicrobiota bacterium]
MEKQSVKIRNVAIIAHVDHGKTTLVDELLKAGGAYHANQNVAERAMDSMDLEREKGITIKSKNTAVHWGGHVINIVDTPGHADFGGEVERVMKMVDGVLLVVDAYEGPQAQTRFVLRKALAEGLCPVVVINKIDRDHAEPLAVKEKVLELFLDLDASDEQFEAAFMYGSARDGYFMDSPDGDKSGGVLPLLQTIIDEVPEPVVEEGGFRMLVSNIDWDNYVGRVAVGRVLSGEVKKGDKVFVHRRSGACDRATITKIFEYSGLGVSESSSGGAGNIVGISGFEDVDIGETLSADQEAEALPFVDIDPPTVQMEFSINDGPFAGQDGKNVTTRQIRDRLMRETKINVSLEVSDSDRAGVFNVKARGAMQIAVLVEQMRREDFEVLVSRPTVIYKTDEETGRKLEPFEKVFVEVPEDNVNGVMRSLTGRRAQVESMDSVRGGKEIVAVIPTRGLIGFETELMNITSGHGVMSHLFHEYAGHCGEIPTRMTGTLVAMETGVATPYSLDALEDRGKLFVEAGETVYQGQVVGENPRADDLPVNPTKEKHLTNHRSKGDGKGIQLSPAIKFSLERAIEYIAPDELVEATPTNLRMRKRILCNSERKRMGRSSKKAAAV